MIIIRLPNTGLYKAVTAEYVCIFLVLIEYKIVAGPNTYNNDISIYNQYNDS